MKPDGNNPEDYSENDNSQKIYQKGEGAFVAGDVPGNVTKIGER